MGVGGRLHAQPPVSPLLPPPPGSGAGSRQGLQAGRSSCAKVLSAQAHLLELMCSGPRLLSDASSAATGRARRADSHLDLGGRAFAV